MNERDDLMSGNTGSKFFKNVQSLFSKRESIDQEVILQIDSTNVLQSSMYCPATRRKSCSRKSSLSLQRSDSFKKKEPKKINHPTTIKQINSIYSQIHEQNVSVLSQSKITYIEPNSNIMFPRITPDILKDIICNDLHKPHFKSYKIIDCRFEYEFKGGHIKNAINLSTQKDIEKNLLELERKSNTLLIFHCEFSSHRGPILASHLRNCDRMLHYDNYPNLFYPDIVIVNGGYKDFYARFPELCYPNNYVEMNSKENCKILEIELTKFRKDSKRVISRTNSSKIFNDFKPEQPPKLSFEFCSNSSNSSDISSDDNISPISTNSSTSRFSVSKTLLMDSLASDNQYFSFDEIDEKELSFLDNDEKRGKKLMFLTGGD
ncbi:hypothetical protein KAFR_0A02310 [Kazachstania africana CBS 2517]|uniref:M-phase inducer phosphatase n=1 Tax=Kazachstania africana (strain ATCC 22294 / BCRC 22015 / CBS 2517 / CECT 1963 / NBRC 1671 / NRRL Y-8276) TaxID=1071382 RepID=H2AMR9_KAZAF|nr:hypothetical protein KAFR_0A02310 [Kazachstania africana CBS 2517]CCF55669.1 hypothetical protein KAFR_0A02310 [Kazachstania africana CBS 2517]